MNNVQQKRKNIYTFKVLLEYVYSKNFVKINICLLEGSNGQLERLFQGIFWGLLIGWISWQVVGRGRREEMTIQGVKADK